ncbi:MAG: hypothetical protein QHG99_07875 [Methanomicrobiales archaeon]|nr:hypothetical protein [Methanomicrobiales archaeon]
MQKSPATAGEKYRDRRVEGITVGVYPYPSMGRSARLFSQVPVNYREFGVVTTSISPKSLRISDFKGTFDENPECWIAPCQHRRWRSPCAGGEDEDTMNDREGIRQNRYVRRKLHNSIVSTISPGWSPWRFIPNNRSGEGASTWAGSHDRDG